MDYEKKYKDALELAKSYYGDGNMFLDTMFPELKESKEHMIWRSILTRVKTSAKQSNFFNDEDIAWLEKNEPTEWSEEDKKMLGLCVNAASGYYNPKKKQALKDWLESLPARFNLQGIRELIDCAEAEGAKDVINNPEKYGLQKLAE